MLYFPHELASDLSPATARCILNVVRDGNCDPDGRKALFELHQKCGLTKSIALELIPEVEALYQAQGEVVLRYG